MALLGSSVDPRLFVQDFSGFTRAADIQGQSMANLGGQIGQGVKDFAQASQERKKLDAETKATRSGIESAIKLGESLGFDVKGMLSPVLAQMDDPNTTPMQAAALGREAANQISNVLNLGFKAQEFDLKKQELGMRQAAFDAERNAPIAPIAPNYKLVDFPVTVNGVTGTMKADYDSNTGMVRRLDGKVFSSVEDAASGKNPIGQGGDVSIDLPEFNEKQEEGGPGVLPELNGVPTPTAEAQTAADVFGAINMGESGSIGLPIEQNQARAVQTGLDIATATAIPGFTPAKEAEKQGVIMTPAQLQEQIASGMKINAVPAEGGNYLVTGMTAGGGPLVNVNTGSGPQQQRETAIDKSLIETKAEAAQAAAQISKVEEVSRIIDEGVKTGFAQDVLMKAGRIFGQDVSNQEAFKAASGNIAMGFVNLTKGAISDKEMQYFTEVLSPNIGTSVEGNKKITDFLRRASQKAAKVEQIISSGMRAGKSAFDIDDEVQKFRNTETLVPKEDALKVIDIKLTPEEQELMNTYK